MNPDGSHSWISAQATTVIDLEDHASQSEITLKQSTAALNASHPYDAFDSSLQGNRSKKRKVERACDFCRRRKTKCDGPRKPGHICTNCIQNARDCTYLEASKPRGPPKAYVTGLEDRIEKIEILLKRLRPEADFSAEIGPPIIRDSWKNEPASPPLSAYPSSSNLRRQNSLSAIAQAKALLPPPSLKVNCANSSHPSAYPPCPPIILALPQASNTKTLTPRVSRENLIGVQDTFTDVEDYDSSSSSESEDYGELSLVRSLQKMSLQGGGSSLKPLDTHSTNLMLDSQWRFHGKASSFKLINAARKFQQIHRNEVAKAAGQDEIEALSTNFRREFFWSAPRWEVDFQFPHEIMLNAVISHLPPPDLAEQLIDNYFAVMNSHFPLLHRQTFDRQWRSRLHEHDIWFACLCLSIFGVGSRWSSDPRVLSREYAEPPPRNDHVWTSVGWKYIHVALEIHRVCQNAILPPCLFEVQTYPIIGLFLRGTSVYTDAWTFVSIGIRKAQDMGAHRRKVYKGKPTVEEELWKRAYWHLVTFDRIGSMILGRACASSDEDVDIDMPLEVDDEYWEHEDSNMAFIQPPGKPPQISAFVCWIKLTQIAALALRKLYTIGHNPTVVTGPRWREETVASLNEALSAWIDEIPEHLRWSPDMANPLFCSQATTLITTYYMVQIVAHRPFIPVPTALTLSGIGSRHDNHNSSDRLEFSWYCLSICMNAARASADILDQHALTAKMKNFASMANSCYICAGVLLVNIWLMKALKKTKGGPEEMKQASEQRMADSTNMLTRLMARLEEISVRMEVAGLWLYVPSPSTEYSLLTISHLSPMLQS
ncbi:fungal-specific transcription factor domain-containing protein [Abortiporus biennis]|nr:fungal-specific transcription factor domain-containing protein [Abortiporus biennis]